MRIEVGSDGMMIGSLLKAAGLVTSTSEALRMIQQGGVRIDGERVALQGNMDPMMLFASPERIREEVAGILSGFGHGSGHVFNLGHGIHPGINPEHAGAMIEAVHELSRPYHT